LAVIEGSLQLLHAQLSEEALRSLGQVLILAERSSQRLASLLEELLSAARREDADLSLTRRAIHLPHLVQDAADAVRTLAEQAQVELALELPQDLPTPKGDPVQLERVMVNLLDNAISYTPQGGRVVIDAVRRPAEVEISVTDTGPGIPPEHREVIFERFTRLPGVEGRRRGFGLGLYFCSRVVAAHGGRIWVEPSPEKMGSRFVFTLPLGTEG
jgi:two-component system clock-associated histidine kinase SasA